MVLRPVHGKRDTVKQSCPFPISIAHNPKGKQHKQVLYLKICQGEVRRGPAMLTGERGAQNYNTRSTGIRKQGEKGWQIIELISNGFVRM